MRRVVSLWLPFWQTDRLRHHSCSGLPVEAALVTRDLFNGWSQVRLDELMPWYWATQQQA